MAEDQASLKLNETGRFVGHAKGRSVRCLVVATHKQGQKGLHNPAANPHIGLSTETTRMLQVGLEQEQRQESQDETNPLASVTPWQDLLISAGSAGRVKIWSIETGECLHTVIVGTETVRRIRLLMDGTILTCGDDHVVQSWAHFCRGIPNKVWRTPAVVFRHATLGEVCRNCFTWILTLLQLAYLAFQDEDVWDLHLNVFRARFYTAACIMFIAIIIVFCDVYHAFSQESSRILCEPSFSDDLVLQKEEKKFDKRRYYVWEVLFISSTLFFIPLCKSASLVLDCRCDVEGQATEGPLSCIMHGRVENTVLAHAPALECYVGEHLYMVSITLLVLPLFAMAMWPLGCTGGDASLLEQEDDVACCRRVLRKLWPSGWRAAMRNRKQIFTGAFSPRVGRGLSFEIGLMLAKLFLSILSAALAAEPWIFRMVHVFVVLTLIIIVLVRPPVVNSSFRCVLCSVCAGNLMAVGVKSWAAAGAPGLPQNVAQAVPWLQ